MMTSCLAFTEWVVFVSFRATNCGRNQPRRLYLARECILSYLYAGGFFFVIDHDLRDGVKGQELEVWPFASNWPIMSGIR